MENLQFYGEYYDILKDKQKLLLDGINSILDNFDTDSENKPVEHIRTRIKSSESAIEKLQKRNIEPTVENALSFLSDMIGVRIITHFVGDVFLIVEEIKKSDIWEVVEIKDYITNSKPNGYRSLHAILKIPVDHENLQSLNVEIQLRTIAMDCWASLEHQLKYKKDIKNPELISGELKRCADEMASTDLSMQTIRDLIKQN